jgi:UDP-N-acetylglucosamine 4,6-dehydratase/5-epimerase
VDKIFITGASGTIGRGFIKKYYKNYKFYSYSRNEKAQVALKREFPEIEIFLGSVEDKSNLETCISNLSIDIILHAAALKHVDTAEKQPSQAFKANILGTLNILETARKFDIPKVVGISTDKACSPDNVYGMSKFLMEKVMGEFNGTGLRTSCCRFGNVAWSNGSVLPFWLNLKASNKPLPLTHKDMTRLIFTSTEAAELIHRSIELIDDTNEFFILSKNMKSCKMIDLAQLISSEIIDIGLRPGEVLYEDLISKKEINNAFHLKNEKYIILSNEKKFTENLEKLNLPVNSETAEKMSAEEMINILRDVKNHRESVNSIKFNY